VVEVAVTCSSDGRDDPPSTRLESVSEEEEEITTRMFYGFENEAVPHSTPRVSRTEMRRLVTIQTTVIYCLD